MTLARYSFPRIDEPAQSAQAGSVVRTPAGRACRQWLDSSTTSRPPTSSWLYDWLVDAAAGLDHRE